MLQAWFTIGPDEVIEKLAIWLRLNQMKLLNIQIGAKQTARLPSYEVK